MGHGTFQFVGAIIGSVIAPGIGTVMGSMIGGEFDNIIFPVDQPNPALRIGTSAYGQAIPQIYGPGNRVGANIIDWSGLKTTEHKNVAKAVIMPLSLLAPKNKTFSVDVAFLLGKGPMTGQVVKRIWIGGEVVFDASAGAPSVDGNGVMTYAQGGGTHQVFESLVVYPGNFTQTPDPTIEAQRGVGNAPAYRGRAYCVMNNLQLATYGNQLPTDIQFEVEERASITVGTIALDICVRCGLDPNTVSTSSISDNVLGYVIGAQTKGDSALQPLALAYDFDIGEAGGGLRLTKRGTGALCAVTVDQLAGHDAAQARPDAFAWSRDPETVLPRSASVTFLDPDRNYQENTQSARRSQGSADSDLAVQLPLVLTADEGRQIADRLLWEAQIGRQGFQAATDDRLLALQVGATYAVEGPAGFETIRLLSAARGVNGVIEWTGKRDKAQLYNSAASGVAATGPANPLAISGPVNPPIIFEPPADLTLGEAEIWIAISGGDGTTADPNWKGCDVWISSDNTDYERIGSVTEASTQGVLTANLSAFVTANPDNTHTLSVDLGMSAGAVSTIASSEAARGASLCYVGGELLSFQTATLTGSFAYDLTTLYRGLHLTTGAAHLSGAAFARVDGSTFKYALPSQYVGVLLYFKLVSFGETLAGATAYTFTPAGAAYGSGAGVVSTQIQASEALTAKDLVNVWNSGGSRVRRANASAAGKPASGYILASVASGDMATVYFAGTLTGLSGLTPGIAYLDTSAGQVTSTAPSTSGQVVQSVGIATSASTLVFNPGTPTTLP